jgi:predicted transcriptional regulator
MMVRLPEDVAAQVRALAEGGDRTPSQQLRRMITAAIRDQEVRQ